MKRNRLVSKMLLILFAAMYSSQLSSQEPAESTRKHDDLSHPSRYLSEVRETEKFALVNEERHLMASELTYACTAPASQYEVHGLFRYCEVYITKESLSIIKNGGIDYPIGTIILKWKYEKKEGGTRQLATVMRKMPVGYSEQHGDWEFGVINANASQVLARGRIESCIKCHDDYKSTGFVSREYLEETREQSDALKDRSSHSGNGTATPGSP